MYDTWTTQIRNGNRKTLTTTGMDLRSAVCITGEARAFRFAAVRASLRIFLAHVNTVALDVAIARYTSACGPSLSIGDRCTAALREGLQLDEAALLAEFHAEAHGRHRIKHVRLELFNTSTCANGRHANHTCCRSPAASTAAAGGRVTGSARTHSNHDLPRDRVSGGTASGPAAPEWRPVAYLQYSELVQCALRLLDLSAAQPLGEQATHLIRTRPDVLYMDVCARHVPSAHAH